MDLNEVAYSVVTETIGDTPEENLPAINLAAVTLGRLGGLKGGRARAEKLTAAQRRKIAIKAAHARWEKKK